MNGGTLWPVESRQQIPQLSVQRLGELAQAFEACLQEQGIDPEASGLKSLFASLYLPMAAWLAEQHHHAPIVIGLHGGQGAGKSTLSRLLQLLLREGFDKTVISLSIDDLYLTRAERQHLAQEVHPLLATRGVPGTHDVTLGLQVLGQLKGRGSDDVLIPRFNKATDEREAVANWTKVDRPVDIVLFEGWCVGAVAQAPQELRTPVNQLEAQEDPDGRWRRYVNQQLQGAYQELFALIDRLVMLKVPSMEQVLQWRLLQEHKLRQSLSVGQGAAGLMDDRQVRRFIMHFERLTRASLQEMPGRADVVLSLDTGHRICEVQVRNSK